MSRLTDASIKSAIRRGQHRRMTDGDGRGNGRLVMVIKPKTGGCSSDWYVQQWRDGRRSTVKIGSYPTMSLATARERFAADYSEALSANESLARAKAMTGGTIADLVDGYCNSLEQRGSKSAYDYRKRLVKFVAFVGENKQARDITPEDVVEYLRPIFQRGKESLADHDRSYIRSAFSWGLKADLDYRSTTASRRFGLVVNPAADIPTAPKRVGTRWLDEKEFAHFYRWLGSPATGMSASYSVCLRVLMLTGQRVQEIAGLTVEQWDSDEKLLTWDKTKNGRPHAIPVCDRVAELLDGLPTDGKWLFPSDLDPDMPMKHGSLYSMLWRKRESIGLDWFTNRDLRRTWKTLTGKAGLTKWERDLLQNHARSDVSSVHYDRHDYLEEKREAVKRWGKWVENLLAQKGPAETGPGAATGRITGRDLQRSDTPSPQLAAH